MSVENNILQIFYAVLVLQISSEMLQRLSEPIQVLFLVLQKLPYYLDCYKFYLSLKTITQAMLQISYPVLKILSTGLNYYL